MDNSLDLSFKNNASFLQKLENCPQCQSLLQQQNSLVSHLKAQALQLKKSQGIVVALTNAVKDLGQSVLNLQIEEKQKDESLFKIFNDFIQQDNKAKTQQLAKNGQFNQLDSLKMLKNQALFIEELLMMRNISKDSVRLSYTDQELKCFINETLGKHFRVYQLEKDIQEAKNRKMRCQSLDLDLGNIGSSALDLSQFNIDHEGQYKQNGQKDQILNEESLEGNDPMNEIEELRSNIDLMSKVTDDLVNSSSPVKFRKDGSEEARVFSNFKGNRSLNDEILQIKEFISKETDQLQQVNQPQDPYPQSQYQVIGQQNDKQNNQQGDQQNQNLRFSVQSQPAELPSYQSNKSTSQNKSNLGSHLQNLQISPVPNFYDAQQLNRHQQPFPVPIFNNVNNNASNYQSNNSNYQSQQINLFDQSASQIDHNETSQNQEKQFFSRATSHKNYFPNAGSSQNMLPLSQNPNTNPSTNNNSRVLDFPVDPPFNQGQQPGVSQQLDQQGVYHENSFNITTPQHLEEDCEESEELLSDQKDKLSQQKIKNQQNINPDDEQGKGDNQEYRQESFYGYDQENQEEDYHVPYDHYDEELEKRRNLELAKKKMKINIYRLQEKYKNPIGEDRKNNRIQTIESEHYQTEEDSMLQNDLAQRASRQNTDRNIESGRLRPEDLGVEENVIRNHTAQMPDLLRRSSSSSGNQNQNQKLNQFNDDQDSQGLQIEPSNKNCLQQQQNQEVDQENFYKNEIEASNTNYEEDENIESKQKIEENDYQTDQQTGEMISPRKSSQNPSANNRREHSFIRKSSDQLRKSNSKLKKIVQYQFKAVQEKEESEEVFQEQMSGVSWMPHRQKGSSITSQERVQVISKPVSMDQNNLSEITKQIEKEEQELRSISQNISKRQNLSIHTLTIQENDLQEQQILKEQKDNQQEKDFRKLSTKQVDFIYGKHYNKLKDKTEKFELQSKERNSKLRGKIRHAQDMSRTLNQARTLTKNTSLSNTNAYTNTNAKIRSSQSILAHSSQARVPNKTAIKEDSPNINQSILKDKSLTNKVTNKKGVNNNNLQKTKTNKKHLVADLTPKTSKRRGKCCQTCSENTENLQSDLQKIVEQRLEKEELMRHQLIEKMRYRSLSHQCKTPNNQNINTSAKLTQKQIEHILELQQLEEQKPNWNNSQRMQHSGSSKKDYKDPQANRSFSNRKRMTQSQHFKGIHQSTSSGNLFSYHDENNQDQGLNFLLANDSVCSQGEARKHLRYSYNSNNGEGSGRVSFVQQGSKWQRELGVGVDAISEEDGEQDNVNEFFDQSSPHHPDYYVA